jgi:hypothetical protein
MVGLHKPDSWRKTILWGVLVGVLIIVAGQLADFVGAKIWHQAAEGPAVIKQAKATWKAALLGLGLVVAVPNRFEAERHHMLKRCSLWCWKNSERLQQ